HRRAAAGQSPRRARTFPSPRAVAWRGVPPIAGANALASHVASVTAPGSATMIERGERMTGVPLRATSAVGCGTRATVASATAAVKRNTSEARERRSKLADPTPAVRAAPELRRRRVRGHLARRRAPRGHVVSPGLQIGVDFSCRRWAMRVVTLVLAVLTSMAVSPRTAGAAGCRRCAFGGLCPSGETFVACLPSQSACIPNGGILGFNSMPPTVPAYWTLFAQARGRRSLGRLRGRLEVWSDYSAGPPSAPGLPERCDTASDNFPICA